LISRWDMEVRSRKPEELLADPRNRCFAHAANLCEVYYDACRRIGPSGADQPISDPASSGLGFRPDMYPAFWQQAGRLKADLAGGLLRPCAGCDCGRGVCYGRPPRDGGADRTIRVSDQVYPPGSFFQVTTDGFAPYKTAVPNTLGDCCDYAMLIKVYKASPEGERKYSPAEVSSVEEIPIMGRPDPERICTSIIERSNLSVRMGTRRFTRLTNAFSKKWENHWAAVSLWYTFYSFCRVHKSLRVTPAMAAGISNHVWGVRELLEA